MWVATTPPPGARPLPCTIRSSPSISTATPFDPAGRRRRRQAVGFLDAQLLEAAHARGAFREGRGHRQDRIFVDHRRRALRRHIDALERGRPHAEVRHLLADVAAQVERLDVGAHLPQRRDQAGAQRIGHDVGRA